ncbi:MAG: helix-turn-helix transcriptional regulator [Ruminococcaceae bacterium]|nr:helix-turn-helix transcriptional regulator [Oscillospiraceae bacterium]
MVQKIKIGEKIRLLRKKNGMTQDGLALRVGVTPQAVSRWESGICYPDMDSLPLIADAFGASMDELLCYDGAKNEQAVKEYAERAEWYLDRDRAEEALELLRSACAELPSSYVLRLSLAKVLSHICAETEDDEKARGMLSEAVSLCRHILEDCAEDGVRDETKKTLCGILCRQVGDDIEAEEIADQLHGMHLCREIVRATVFTGDTARLQAQKNLILFADNIWWHAYNLTCVPDIAMNKYTTDEKIDILLRAMKVYEIVFNGDYLFYADRLANSYRQLAMLYLSKGNNQKALDCVEKMADFAIICDNRPSEARYKSVLLREVEYRKSEDTEAKGMSKCARILQSRFAARIWSPIRQNERFRAAVMRMAECAENFESEDGEQ